MTEPCMLLFFCVSYSSLPPNKKALSSICTSSCTAVCFSGLKMPTVGVVRTVSEPGVPLALGNMDLALCPCTDFSCFGVI